MGTAVMSTSEIKPMRSGDFGACLALACAALLCLQAALTESAQAADLDGYQTYDRRAYPAEDSRYADIYEIPRRDGYREPDFRRDDIAADGYREDRRYDARNDRYDRHPGYEYSTRPAVSDRYVPREHDTRFFREQRHAHRYVDRVPDDRPLSLKDTPRLSEPSAVPSRYERDRYESYSRETHRRYDMRAYDAEHTRERHVRFRDDNDRYERACLQRREIKRSLRNDGWRGFLDFELRRDLARVNARRSFDGRRFILTLDSCTGDIIAALPIEPRYNRW